MVIASPVIIGYSADGRPSVALLADDTVLINGRHGEQLADNEADHPDFTVCNNIIRCVYRAELILGR